MSDAVKWALLGAAAIALIAVVVSLPFMAGLNTGEFGMSVSRIVSIAGQAFSAGRGLINNFLTPFGRGLLTGLIYYLFGKFFIIISVKIGSWIYHWIFK